MGIVNRLGRVRRQLERRLAEVFAEHDLTAADFLVVVNLRRAGEPYCMPQARLMDALGLTSGTVSLRLDRLVKAGTVARQPDPNDRRGSLIRLSSVTHTFNQSQLIYPLIFSATGSATLTAAGPLNANLAPPGPYMLFLVNAKGVPSKAKMVTVGP